MTLATMADRSLPLAERVEAYRWADRADSGFAAAHAALLADVAAADRLARAGDVASAAAATAGSAEYTRLTGEFMAALGAYRARMAQGVGDV